MNKRQTYTHWILALWVALGVLIPSLFFKFAGAAESRHIFATVGEFLGMGFFEPYGRYFTGMAELLAAVLLIVPVTRVYGALITMGVLSGAIFFHLFSPLGIVVRWEENSVAMEDGTLFMLAVSSFVFCLVIAWLRRHTLPFIQQRRIGGRTPPVEQVLD